MEKNIFLSYASGSFIQARDELCNSAKKVGFDMIYARGFDDLNKDFIEKNEKILVQKRGAGYWIWKPQIILQELRKLNKGDLLVYSDAGRSSYYQFSKFPKRLAELARKKGFLLGPTIGQHGPMSQWTKRDAFVLLDMDRKQIYELPPIQATWSFWTPCEDAFKFLEEWVYACEDPRILTDMPNTQKLLNTQDFQDHRHDQSVMSLLAYKNKVPYLNFRYSIIERLLRMRKKSGLSHLFGKRISDIEDCYQVGVIGILISLFKSWFDLKNSM